MPHPPNRLNTLQAFRYQTKVFALLIKDQDGRVVKLGEAQIFMTVKESAVAEVALISKSVGNGIEVTGADQGKARVTLNTNDTGGLAPGTYKYDIWIELPGDPVERQPVVRAANLEIVQGVTSFPVVGSSP